MQVKNGTRTINEVRAEDGLEPVPWGDEPWQSDTLIQPTDAAAAREHAQGVAELAAKKPTPDADETPAKDEPKVKDRALWDRFGRALEQLEAEIAA